MSVEQNKKLELCPSQFGTETRCRLEAQPLIFKILDSAHSLMKIPLKFDII